MPNIPSLRLIAPTGIAILALLGAVGACTSPSETQSTRLRMIPESPASIFTLEAVSEFSPWTDLPLPADRALGGSGQDAAIEVVTNLDASDFGQIQFGFSKVPTRVTVRASSSRDSGSLHPITVAAWQDFDSAGRFVVDLSAIPEGMGTIRRLLLEGHENAKRPPRLESVRYRSRTLVGDKLASALTRGWKTLIGGDLRSTRLAVPGAPIEWRVDVPTNARLQWSFAVPPSLEMPVDFSIAHGEEVLWSARVEGPTRGWQDSSLDLERFANRTVTLRFAAAADDAYSPQSGIPVWGNPEIVPSESRERPNIVLISVDTLRADHLSLYGYERETSPRLDRWASTNAVTFETTVASAPWTLPSHVSMLTGISALRHGVNHSMTVPAGLETLPAILRDDGYQTAAFTGGSYLDPRFGLHLGFDRYRSQPGSRTELSKNLVLAEKWLSDERDAGPFFLFLHTYEVHEPYRAHERFLSEQSADLASSVLGVTGHTQRIRAAAGDGYRTRRKLTFRSQTEPATETVPQGLDAETAARALYDSGIAQMDELIGEFLDTLESHDSDRETLVILTSDHGESFGEDHGGKPLYGHANLHDSNLLVPLIVRFPDKRFAKRRVPEQVRLVDIAPTVLDVAGIQVPDGLDGRSLVPLLAEEAAHPRTATSYSPRSSHGVSFRVANRAKYIWQNSPWCRANCVTAFDVGSRPQHEVEVPEVRLGPGKEGFVELAREQLEQGPGLEIRLSNPSSTRSTCFTLESEIIDAGTLKVHDALENKCSWKPPDSARCCLKPSRELDLLVEGIDRREIQIAFSASNDLDRLEATVSAGVDELREWHFLDSEARLTPVRPQAASTLALRFRSPYELEPSSATADPDLLRQLRAMGYIE